MKKQLLTEPYKRISSLSFAKTFRYIAIAMCISGLAESGAQNKSWIRTTLDDSHITLDKQNQAWVYYYNKIRSYSGTGVMGPLVSFQGVHFQKIEFINNTDFYAAGTFTGSISPGGKTINSNGGRDIFVGKFNTGGGVEWISSFGSTADEYMTYLHLRNDGKLSLSGIYTSTIKNGADSLTAASGLNLYFAEVSSSGTIAFKNKIQGSGAEPWSVYMTGMTSDAQGNFYTGIRYQGNCIIKGQTYNSSYGTLILKLNPSGQLVWEKNIIGELTIADMEIDRDNLLCFAGSFKNSLSADNETVESKGFEDICLARMDHNGNVLWLKRAGGSSYFDNASSIFISKENEILLCGSFRESADFDSITLVSEGEADGYIVRYNKDGKAFRASSTGSSGMDVIMESSSFGEEVYVIGYHQQSMIWGSTPMTGEGVFIGKLAMAAGLKDKAENKMLLYPNPCVNGFRIDLEDSGHAEKVEIMDMQGKVVHSEEGPGPEIKFELPSGIYFVKVTSKKGTSIQKIAIR